MEWTNIIVVIAACITTLGYLKSIFNDLKADIKTQSQRIDQTNQRIDFVMSQILDIQKEIKQLYMERK